MHGCAETTYYFSKGGPYITESTIIFAGLAWEVEALEKALEEAIKYSSAPTSAWDVFAHYFSWFSNQSNELPSHLTSFASHFSGFTSSMEDPANHSRPGIRAPAEDANALGRGAHASRVLVWASRPHELCLGENG